MHMLATSGRLKTAFATLWRRYIVDECPDEKMERIRRERITHIQQDVALLEAMRCWRMESEKAAEVSLPAEG